MTHSEVDALPDSWPPGADVEQLCCDAAALPAPSDCRSVFRVEKQRWRDA
jgi:hypothetical protein